MIENIIIRRANEKDIDFLIETIIEAEKSGTDKISYCNIFKINESELKNILKEILLEDFEGQELNISGFLIAEVNGNKAAAVNSWIEMESGVPSKIIKANLLLHYFGNERCINASKEFNFLEELNIERKNNSIQIESVYVKDEYRGIGLCNKLIIEHVNKLKNKKDSVENIQIILAKTNEQAYKAYKKLGFKITIEKKSFNPKVLDILPSDTKIMMECEVEKI